MDLKKTNLLKKAYKIFMAIYSALFVAAFIAILCVIYYTGPIASEGSDRAFTFDSKIVTEMLGYLLVPFILLIVFIIAGQVIFFLYPSKENEMVKPLPMALLSKVKKYDLNEVEDQGIRKEIKKYRGLRIGITIFTTIFVIINALVVILYLLNGQHYSLEGSIIDNNISLFLAILPFVLISICWGFAAIFINNTAANKEIALLKKAKLFKIDRSITSKDYLGKRRDFYSYITIGTLVALGIIVAMCAVVFGGAGALITLAAVVGFITVILLNKKPKTKKSKCCSCCPIENYNPKVENTFVWIIRAIVFVIAITFIILGVFNGGVRDVLIKAINICTECIGLG